MENQPFSRVEQIPTAMHAGALPSQHGKPLIVTVGDVEQMSRQAAFNSQGDGRRLSMIATTIVIRAITAQLIAL
jgi:hypothetical protein